MKNAAPAGRRSKKILFFRVFFGIRQRIFRRRSRSLCLFFLYISSLILTSRQKNGHFAQQNFPAADSTFSPFAFACLWPPPEQDGLTHRRLCMRTILLAASTRPPALHATPPQQPQVRSAQKRGERPSKSPRLFANPSMKYIAMESLYPSPAHACLGVAHWTNESKQIPEVRRLPWHCPPDG